MTGQAQGASAAQALTLLGLAFPQVLVQQGSRVLVRSTWGTREVHAGARFAELAHITQAGELHWLCDPVALESALGDELLRQGFTWELSAVGELRFSASVRHPLAALDEVCSTAHGDSRVLAFMRAVLHCVTPAQPGTDQAITRTA